VRRGNTARVAHVLKDSVVDISHRDTGCRTLKGRPPPLFAGEEIIALVLLVAGETCPVEIAGGA
jgi:hypothetical protein